MKPKCKICGKKIEGLGCYLNAKLVCQKCYYRNKYSKRMPRAPAYWHRILGVGK